MTFLEEEIDEKMNKFQFLDEDPEFSNIQVNVNGMEFQPQSKYPGAVFKKKKGEFSSGPMRILKEKDSRVSGDVPALKIAKYLRKAFSKK